MKIAANLEILGQGQIKNFRPEILSADPDSAALFVGRGWWNTTESALKFYDGTNVLTIAVGGALGDYLRLDGTVAMTGDLLLASADQSASADNVAVSKGYVVGLLAEKQDTITGAATTIVSDQLTASMAVVSDAQGKVAVSDVTTTELSRLTGVTDNVQTQIDGKQDDLGYTPVNKAGDSMDGNIAMQGNRITGLSAPVDGTEPVRLADLDASLAGFNWQDDVRGVQTDATLVPELVTGNRYILTDVAALDATFGTITGVENGDIVEYDGAAFQVVYDVSADANAEGAIAFSHADQNYVRYVGAEWKVFYGLEALVAGVGLSKDGNTFNVNLGAGIAQLPTDEVGIDLEADAGLGLFLGGVESTDTAAKLAVKLTGTTLERTIDGLRVAQSGIGAEQLDGAALGNGLTGGDGAVVSVVAKADGGIVVDADGVSVDNTVLAQTFLSKTGDTAADLKVTAAPATDTDVVRKLELDAAAAAAADDLAAVVTRIEAGEVVYDGLSSVQDTHVITHNLGNLYPMVEVMDANGETVLVESVVRTDANTVTITVVPASGIRAVIQGVKASA